MANKPLQMTDSLYQYLQGMLPPLSPLQVRLREETSRLPQGHMQIPIEQGHFIGFLLRLLNARKCLEIGTFTGYSALVTALALPDDGTLLCCDISDEYTQIARRYWREANVSDKITLALGYALPTLERLLDEGYAETFDWIFMDADRPSYFAYYEASLMLLRQGGVLGIDNTLWGGRVADADVNDESSVVFRVLNAHLQRDARIDLSVVPIGDGLSLCRKR